VSSDPQSSADGQVHVDTDMLKQGADALSALAARLTTAGQQFQADCDSYGEPWGDDSTGQKFYAQYKKPHSDAVDAGVSGGKVLSEAAGQLTDLVAALTAVEERAVATGQQMVIEPNNGG
jgi:hypothetical protein